jgi:hypothetical protein
MRIQALYGVIPKIYGKGDLAKVSLFLQNLFYLYLLAYSMQIFQRTVDMMLQKRKEILDSENQISPQIDCLLLIDRNVDLLTPLCTQLTYEGLIDEIYGISNSKLILLSMKLVINFLHIFGYIGS